MVSSIQTEMRLLLASYLASHVPKQVQQQSMGGVEKALGKPSEWVFEGL